jgi:hypothetical protein
MQQRKSRERSDEDQEDRPRKARRKVRKNGGSLVWLFVILGVVALAAVGGVVVFLVLRDGNKETSKTGDGLLDKLDGGSSGRSTETEQMVDHFMGRWEGDSPERPSVKVWLEVTRERIILQGENIRIKEWGAKLVYSWKPASVSGQTMIINRQEVVEPKRDLQWSLRFASDDAMSIISLVDNRLIANFRRIGKMITQRDREKAASENSAKLIGKWSVPTFQSIKLRSGTLEFAEGGKAVFTINRDKIGDRTDTGTWQVLEAQENKLKLEIRGIEDFDLLHIELRSDKEMALSQASKAGFTGVQLSATRVP